MNQSASQVYVLEADGRHSGPTTTLAVAQRIVDGNLSQDALIAPPGAPQWLHASQLPDILMVVQSLRRASAPPPPAPHPAAPPASAKVPAAQPAPAKAPVTAAAAAAPAAQVTAVSPVAAAAAAAPAAQVTAVSPVAAPKSPAPAAAGAPSKPWPRHLSLMIFGGFLAIGAIECVIAAITTTDEGSAEMAEPSTKASPR